MLRRLVAVGLGFGLLAQAAPASADCEECRLQPWGQMAGKFTCIMSIQNYDCACDPSPCEDCIDYGTGTACPI